MSKERERIPNKDEGGWFLPRTKLAEIQEEIERLRAKKEAEGLRAREERKLRELRGVTRRELLKKSGTAVAVVGALAGGAEMGRRYYQEHKKVNLPTGIKGVIGEYNEWLKKGSTGEEPVSAFVRIFNAWRKRFENPAGILEFGEEDFSGDLKNYNEKVKPLEKTLEAQGYFLRALPMIGSDVALMFGKIVGREKKDASAPGSAPYEQIILDSDSPEESENLYSSGTFRITATTLKMGNEVKVIQRLSAYRDTARKAYENFNQKPESEWDVARRITFERHKNLGRKEFIETVQKLYLETSREHEEQHVLDKAYTEDVPSKVTLEKLSWLIVTEMRGLFKPLQGANPRVALLSIINWSGASDTIRRSVGTLTRSIVYDVSGKEAMDVLESSSDREIREIGRDAMGASDILFDSVVKKGKSLKDPEIQQKFSQYMELLRKTRER